MSSERFPAFFDQVPRLVVRDPLAEFLGAAEGGVLEYGYADAVRLAGHSCPTVASAYALAHHALTRLFPGELPVRGMVQVSFQHPLDEGVTGVIAAVLGLLSGSAQDGGFKGIAGRFVRRNLQHFGEHQPLALRFVRSDSGATVHAAAELSKVQPHPEMAELMRRCMRGEAAPAGSSFVILTHDHALDFLIAAEALKRPDAAYVGMIGSKTKRATFRNWLSREVGQPDLFENLICPIGGTAVKDKRPAVIATLAASEIMTAALTWSANGAQSSLSASTTGSSPSSLPISR